MNRQLNMFDPPPAPPAPRQAQGAKATPDTPMEDHWPPNRLTPAVMRAYRRAEDEGLIRIEKVTISRSTGAAVVRYLSAIPVTEWVREALKEYKEGACESDISQRLERPERGCKVKLEQLRKEAER